MADAFFGFLAGTGFAEVAFLVDGGLTEAALVVVDLADLDLLEAVVGLADSGLAASVLDSASRRCT